MSVEQIEEQIRQLPACELAQLTEWEEPRLNFSSCGIAKASKCDYKQGNQSLLTL